MSLLETGEFKSNLKTGQLHFRKGEEKYELIVGKTRFVHDYYNELIVPLEEKIKPFRKINLIVRAFNDGLAFRYEFTEQEDQTSISITEENTSFKFSTDPKVLALLLPNYNTSHEGEYSSLRLSEIKEDTLIDMPVLFEFPQGIYAAITEAALVNYAGMYLSRHHGILTSKLSPLPNQQNIKVKAMLPHKSPWRVIFVSEQDRGLMESNLLTSLNEPSQIKDCHGLNRQNNFSVVEWKCGTPDTLNAPGNNFVTNQYYIDFCARNGIEYHSVVEYGLHQWYVDDGVNFQPGPNADVTKPVPGLDMKEICDYAK